MQKPNSNKSRQANPNVDQTRRPKTARQKKLGVVGGPGRPTDLPTWPSDLAREPHYLNQGTWRLPVGPLRWFGVLQPVAPCYKYKGGGE